MKISKVKTIIIASALVLTPLSVNAAEYHEPTENDYVDLVDSMFQGMDENELVLEMPEGGYLSGPGVCVDTDITTGEVIAEYNVQTDPNAITVKEAKAEILDTFENGKMTRGVNPPASNTLRTLAYGDIYTSSPFSGSGWRFSGMQFKASSGSGDYLKWSSYIDGGRVGNYNEAYATKNSGTLQGTAINAGQSIWNSEGSLGQIYYTYNPVAGTYYQVGNVNS